MKHDRCGPTKKGLIDSMRIQARSFRTEDELGLTEVMEIRCKVRFLSPDDSSISRKGVLTLLSFGRIIADLKVPIDLYRTGKVVWAVVS